MACLGHGGSERRQRETPVRRHDGVMDGSTVAWLPAHTHCCYGRRATRSRHERAPEGVKKETMSTLEWSGLAIFALLTAVIVFLVWRIASSTHNA